MTSLRFPLPASLFPPMKVTNDQALQFASTCERIVHSTMDARHEYVHRYNRQLRPSTWQLVKRRTGGTSEISVYKPHRNSKVPRPAATATSSPILIGTGVLEGSLDEVMLGVSATNTSAMRFVASALFKDVADARVLTRIDTPNDVDPFGFLGFKWLVKKPSMQFTPLARARDFIYIESSGVRELDDGSGLRVGYQLMHSVDLSCCPELPVEFGVVRGYISFCFLFVETQENVVEMFCKGFVDPRGGLSLRLTVSVAADVIMGCAKAVECAQRKKVEWTLQETNAAKRTTETHSQGPANNDCEAMLCESPARSCGRNTYTSGDDQESAILGIENCLHCSSGRRRRSTIAARGQESVCGVCGDRVCGHCSRQVELPGSSAAPGETVTCCRRCIDRIESVDASSVARELARRAMAYVPQRRHSSQTAWERFSKEKVRLAPIQKKPQQISARDL